MAGGGEGDGLVGHGLAGADEEDPGVGRDRRHARIGPRIGDHPLARLRAVWRRADGKLSGPWPMHSATAPARKLEPPAW